MNIWLAEKVSEQWLHDSAFGKWCEPANLYDYAMQTVTIWAVFWVVMCALYYHSGRDIVALTQP